MSNRILMIAFHYPPVFSSSGLHRTVSFAKHLAKCGWDIDILTVSLLAYGSINHKSTVVDSPSIRVHRAFARDTSRHFALKGKYLGFMTLPDRWQSWIPGGVLKGLSLIRTRRPDIIYSTYPIASAHVIGYALHKLTKIPWVADFRDPMAQDGYPANPTTWRLFKWIEEKAVIHARKMIFVTPGALKEYQTRYPEVDGDRWEIITNGYDEDAFKGLESNDKCELSGTASDKIEFLHSGLVYTKERNPEHLFEALRRLKKAGKINRENFNLRLRAYGEEGNYRSRLAEMEIDDIVALLPPIPYREALEEMMSVDALLLMQGNDCNQQIPAKAYEYLRAQKPILALTDPQGDTGALLTHAGVGLIKPLDDVAAIEEGIVATIEKILNKGSKVLRREEYERYSRSQGAETLRKVFRSIIE